MQIALTFEYTSEMLKCSVLHKRGSGMCYITRRLQEVGVSEHVDIRRYRDRTYFLELTHKKMRKYAFESVFSAYLCPTNRLQTHCHSMTDFVALAMDGCTNKLAQRKRQAVNLAAYLEIQL